jgi:hypothetical protein
MTSDITKRFANGCVIFIGGVLIGMALSKLSARIHYDLGFNEAVNNQDKACLAWWFDNSALRLKQAKHYSCGAR